MQFSSKNRDAKIISELYKDPFKDKFDKEEKNSTLLCFHVWTEL